MSTGAPQLSLEKTFLVSIWVESLLYGFFTSIFLISLYTNLKAKGRLTQTVHSRNMFYIGVVMWVIATLHVAMNCFRMIAGYIDNKNVPGGPAAWIGNLAPWHHIFKDTLYATQELLGDAAAIYRTYIVWQKNWKVIVAPTIIFLGSITSGYAVCGLYSSFDPNATVFDPKLLDWITTFYSLAVVQNVTTTGLLIYRIWTTEMRSSAAGRVTKGNLIPVLLILVESAALQVVIEIILLSLYSANLNVQYILLEMVTPIVGITFTAISLRISVQQEDNYRSNNASNHIGSAPTHMGPTVNGAASRGLVVNILRDVKTDGSFGNRIGDEEIGMSNFKKDSGSDASGDTNVQGHWRN